MADAHNVFISWSGERSKLAAEALKDWVETVLQNARPWMSTEIEKGTRSFDEIARALEGMKVGIICLTPENLTSEWLHYEAGALSKTLDAKTRVCTYLLSDLESTTIKPPLSWFQWTKANKADTRKLIGTINKHLGFDPLSESTLSVTFEKWWPDLEAKLAALPAPSATPPPTRTSSDMITEILDLTRDMAPGIQDISRFATESLKKSALQDAYIKSVLRPGNLSMYSTAAAVPLSGLAHVASDDFLNIYNQSVINPNFTPPPAKREDSGLVPEPYEQKRTTPEGRRFVIRRKSKKRPQNTPESKDKF